MSQTTDARPHERELRNAKILLGLAVLSLAIAVAAGLVLTLATVENGSTLEGFLGLAAAIGGLGTAAFAVAGAIYAQVKDLWRYAPSWFRALAWGVIVVGLVATALNLLDQLS
jgi:hypothetical protein